MDGTLPKPFRRRAPDRLRRSLPLLLAAAVLTGAGCGEGASEGAAGPPMGPPPVVEVETVRAAPFRPRIELVGELRADESVVVQPELSGVVASVEFEEGQKAAEGDVLFRLRDGEQRSRLREAEARLSLARDEYGRTKRLASRNAAAAAQLDRAKAELEVAHAQVDLARVELERTRIRAPFDGFVGRRLVSPGAHITEETELVRVDAVDRLEALFTMPEPGMQLARLGARVWITVAPYPDERFPAEVFFVDPRVDPQTRRLPMKARVENVDGRLRPGLFARVQLEVEERFALRVPAESVVRDGEGAYVWVIDAEDQAHQTRVELGLHQDGRVEIRAGLQEGDRVVASGTHKVQAGGKVQAVARAPSASSDAVAVGASAPGDDG